MTTQTQSPVDAQTGVRNPVRWFEIYVQDLNRAKAFYESVFQVKLQKLDTPNTIKESKLELWGFPSNQKSWGSSGALVKMEGAPVGGGGTVVYFASEDCAVEEKRVTQFGGKIHRPKISIGQHGFITLAVDPDGNMIGIHSMK